MTVLFLLLGAIFVLFAAILGTIAFVLIFSKENKVRKRIASPAAMENVSEHVFKGTFQKDFSERQRLSVALGLSAKKENGKIKIKPQGRLSKEALIESLGG